MATETEMTANLVAERQVAARANTVEFDQLVARVAALEQCVGEQEEALRRVIAMMIEWMENPPVIDAQFMQNSRAA